MNRPLLRCGCVAMAEKMMPDGSRIPACVVHAPDPKAYEIVTEAPDLRGRLARCAYFGKGGFRNFGPIYGGGQCSRQECKCLVPSNYDLPFFEYAPTFGQHKEGEDRFFCGCAGWD